MVSASAESEQVRFLRALRNLSAASFADDLTGSIEAALARAGTGEQIKSGEPFEKIAGALLSRVRVAVERPTLPLLRDLWIIIGKADAGDLRTELDRLVCGWRDAKGGRAREQSALVEWFRRREHAIARCIGAGP